MQSRTSIDADSSEFQNILHRTGVEPVPLAITMEGKHDTVSPPMCSKYGVSLQSGWCLSALDQKDGLSIDPKTESIAIMY